MKAGGEWDLVLVRSCLVALVVVAMSVVGVESGEGSPGGSRGTSWGIKGDSVGNGDGEDGVGNESRNKKAAKW